MTGRTDQVSRLRTPGGRQRGRCGRLALLMLALAAWSAPAAAASRIKDIADFEGVRTNMLIGYGLVVGLNGTGDSLRNSMFTQESLVAMLERLEELRFGLLDGSVPLASLRRLRLDLVRSEPVDEPVLREVLAAIDQRAAVELAKLELAVVPLRPTLSHDVALAPVGETLPPQLAHS